MSPLENCYLLIGIVDREDFFESVPKLHFQSAIISPVVNNTEKFVKIKTYLINLKQGNVCCFLWCLMGKVKQKTNARQEKKNLKNKTKQSVSSPGLIDCTASFPSHHGLLQMESYGEQFAML